MSTVLVSTVLAASLLGGACTREIVGTPPPVDRPHFPTGLALHPDRPLLVVVSSNFDLAYNRGAILLADLAAVDAAIADAGDRVVRLEGASSPYTAGATIPSFGNEPVFIGDGARLLLPTREENIIAQIPLDLAEEPSDVGFDCAVSPELEVPVCAQAPLALQLPGNDPFDLSVVTQNASRVDAIVTLLNSPDVFYVRVDLEGGGGTMQLLTGPSFTLTSTDGDPLGVRGLALRPAGDGVPTTAFLTVNRTSLGLATNAVDLVWFDATRGDGAELRRLRLTEEIGSTDARDVVIHPSGEALFLLLRNPDALVRVDLFPSGGNLTARIGGVVPTCFDPTQLATVVLPTSDGEVERVLVTCFENDTLLSYDALSLVETETLRGFGDGPYGLAVDAAHVPPRAYVSFFEDDTVGVIDLIDDEGEVALVPRALIVGAPRGDELPGLEAAP